MGILASSHAARRGWRHWPPGGRSEYRSTRLGQEPIRTAVVATRTEGPTNGSVTTDALLRYNVMAPVCTFPGYHHPRCSTSARAQPRQVLCPLLQFEGHLAVARYSHFRSSFPIYVRRRLLVLRREGTRGSQPLVGRPGFNSEDPFSF